MTKLEFFWDVASPYTYFASTQIDALAQRAGAELVYRPFLIGGVFKSSGNVMPGANPFKAKYMLADLARWRDLYEVPFLLPAAEVTFPINSLYPMRVAEVFTQQGKGKEYCHAIMKAYWADGHDVSQAEHLSAVIESLGADANEIMEAAKQQELKDSLRKSTDEAGERGAFGAPTFFIEDEMFWGNDRLEFIEKKLRTA